MASELEVLQILMLLSNAYPSFELRHATADVYVRLLASLPTRLLEKAALEHIGKSNFFPTVAELRNTAYGIQEEVLSIPDAHEAWAEVQAEIVRVGHLDQPEFSSELIAEASERIGWRTLCLSENPVADRAHFVQAYQSLVEQSRREIRRLPEVKEFIRLEADRRENLLLPQGEEN